MQLPAPFDIFWTARLFRFVSRAVYSFLLSIRLIFQLVLASCPALRGQHSPRAWKPFPSAFPTSIIVPIRLRSPSCYTPPLPLLRPPHFLRRFCFPGKKIRYSRIRHHHRHRPAGEWGGRLTTLLVLWPTRIRSLSSGVSLQGCIKHGQSQPGGSRGEDGVYYTPYFRLDPFKATK